MPLEQIVLIARAIPMQKFENVSLLIAVFGFTDLVKIHSEKLSKMPRKQSNKLNFTFTALPSHITKSEAFKACNAHAKVIWFKIMELYNGSNNGEISLSVRQAGEYAGCSPNYAGKHINQLIEVGLIDRTMKTGFTSGKRLACTYALTHLPIGTKTATDRWKKFKNQ